VVPHAFWRLADLLRRIEDWAIAPVFDGGLVGGGGPEQDLIPEWLAPTAACARGLVLGSGARASLQGELDGSGVWLGAGALSDNGVAGVACRSTSQRWKHSECNWSGFRLPARAMPSITHSSLEMTPSQASQASPLPGPPHTLGMLL
jgi:hypothetical protein